MVGAGGRAGRWTPGGPGSGCCSVTCCDLPGARPSGTLAGTNLGPGTPPVPTGSPPGTGVMEVGSWTGSWVLSSWSPQCCSLVGTWSGCSTHSLSRGGSPSVGARKPLPVWTGREDPSPRPEAGKRACGQEGRRRHWCPGTPVGLRTAGRPWAPRWGAGPGGEPWAEAHPLSSLLPEFSQEAFISP